MVFPGIAQTVVEAPVKLTGAEYTKALHSAKGPARTIHHPQTK